MSTPPRSANDVRRAFLDFFVRHGHTEVASAPLIPYDPTVMFTVAGMVPFKAYFTGDEVAPYKRAVSSQKCARAGGKHNDLDDVGRTARHCVFFEMLGNFSFGDYFKSDAIPFAWDFVTNVLGYDPELLWVTVHESDDEAEEIWLDVSGLPKNRIQRLGDKENFWQMGDTGPCGPCSEIFIDKGPKWGHDGGPLHGGEERFLEFWNLVFMQYDQRADGSRDLLPKPSIDTGAGLERNLSILQGVDSIWETDLLAPLIESASSLTATRYTAAWDSADDLSLRILAEHARSATMLVSDGVFPSNEGRGYVLRRILRRAIRHAYRLGTEKLILAPMVDTAIAIMGDAYPAVREKRDFINGVVAREEERFRQTLKTGSVILDNELDALQAKGGIGAALSGAVAFQLHDTYGFPLELTTEITAERNVPVDIGAFNDAMAEQQRRARDARKNATTPEALAEQYRAIIGRNGTTEFVGYTATETEAIVVGVVQNDEDLEVFLDRTPFYAESGGQVGDTGTITTLDGVATVVDTTYALPGLIRHVVTFKGDGGSIEVGARADLSIDAGQRDATRKNHTGTHLLHWALRQVLGQHVKQAGSLVGPDRLRFDFSHYDAVTPEQIRRIETLANEIVLTGAATENPEVAKSEAEQMGAVAFFGDKYGDKVRVLRAGPSLEFCGGTHVANVGQIGAIKIVHEGSIGSNLRRIEATTGLATIDRLRTQEGLLAAAAVALKVPPDAVPGRIEALLGERRELERQIETARRQAAGGAAAELATAAEDGVVVARRDGPERDDLRDLAIAVREQPGIRVVVLMGAPDGGGVALVAAVTKASGLNASTLIAAAAKAVGGGGGKAADLAMAGGRHPERLDEALALARAAVGLPASG